MNINTLINKIPFCLLFIFLAIIFNYLTQLFHNSAVFSFQRTMNQSNETPDLKPDLNNP